MKHLRYCITFLLAVSMNLGYGQQFDTSLSILKQLPDKYYTDVDNKLSSIDEKLTKKSLQYLAKFQRQEKKLQQNLDTLDTDATNVFANSGEKYKQLGNQLKTKFTQAYNKGGAYNSYIDTLSTSLSFLKKLGVSSNVTSPINSLSNLQSRFQQSEKIKEFIAQRKQQIKDLLSSYAKIPRGLTKEYAGLTKTAYYYTAQVNEYKEMLKDPSKAEQKALTLLNKVPAFQNFMRKNSQLASLFAIPNNPGNLQSLAGLQTRSSVQALIQQRVSAGDPNAQQIMQQNITQAKSELDKLKEKANQFGGGSSDIQMPDFKPNSQKTKSFLQRLEYGADIQFEKSSNAFPSTANMGLSLGYKLNDKSIIGIGMSYKMGMGTIRHIVISHQGIGLRSFADYNIKKLMYISGGYEMNYNAGFKRFQQLQRFDDWQSSGLVGLSKKYNVSRKVKGEMKLLYDFLANTHRPVTQPVIFRMGYNF